MKRVLTAVAIGGLMIFAVPQGAWADHAPDHHGGESAEHSEGGEPESQPAPDEHQTHGDRESHDSDGGFLLF
jgi:hypothetical protein